MFNNSKFQTFYETYSQIKDTEMSLALLKDFMFSLPTDELMDFMLDTGKAHNETIEAHLLSDGCTEDDKVIFRQQFYDLLAAFASPVLSQAA
jgi:hypothetical protein